MAEVDPKSFFRVGEPVQVRDKKPIKDGGTDSKWMLGEVTRAEEGKFWVLVAEEETDDKDGDSDEEEEEEEEEKVPDATYSGGVEEKKTDEENESKEGIVYAEIRVPLVIPPFVRRDRVEVFKDGEWKEGLVAGGENFHDDNDKIRVHIRDENGDLSKISYPFDPENLEEIRFNDKVQFEKGSPGGGRYIPKDGIRAASEKAKGHFRLIKKEVWDEYVAMYPGSGPMIVATEKPYTNPENWAIDQDFMHTYRETGLPPERQNVDEVADLESFVGEHEKTEDEELERLVGNQEASLTEAYEDEASFLERSLAEVASSPDEDFLESSRPSVIMAKHGLTKKDVDSL